MNKADNYLRTAWSWYGGKWAARLRRGIRSGSLGLEHRHGARYGGGNRVSGLAARPSGSVFLRRRGGGGVSSDDPGTADFPTTAVENCLSDDTYTRKYRIWFCKRRIPLTVKNTPRIIVVCDSHR